MTEPSGVRGHTSVPDRIAVNVGRGLVVWHTREEWERFLRGVDVEASFAMTARLERDEEPQRP
jgi:hypothetical protein